MANKAVEPTNGVSDDLVSAYFDALKDAYVRLRQRWRPEFHKVAKEYDPLFLSAARKLAELNLCPYEYTHYVFDIMTKNHDDVFPAMITSLKLVRKFADEKPELDDRLQLLLQLQASNVKERMAGGEKLRDILLSPTSELSVVFRIAAANAYGLPDLVERFWADAKQMLIFKPAYKKYLGNWLPKELMNA